MPDGVDAMRYIPATYLEGRSVKSINGRWFPVAVPLQFLQLSKGSLLKSKNMQKLCKMRL